MIRVQKHGAGTTNIIIEREPLKGFEIAKSIRDGIMEFRRNNHGEMPDFVLIHADYRNRLFEYMVTEFGNHDMDNMQILGVSIAICLHMKERDKLFVVSSRGNSGIRFNHISQHETFEMKNLKAL